MIKKLIVILICMFLFAVPVLSQGGPYQDLLDDIQNRSPDGIPKMPVIMSGAESAGQHFETGLEDSPILKLVKEGWIPAASNREALNVLYPKNFSPRETIVHHHHYDSPDDPILKLITAPPPQPDLIRNDPSADLFYYLWLYSPSYSSQHRWP